MYTERARVCADVYRQHVQTVYARGPGLGSLLRFPLGGSTAIKVLRDKTRQIARYFEEALPRTRHPPSAWQRLRQESIFPAKWRMCAAVILLYVSYVNSDLYQQILRILKDISSRVLPALMSNLMHLIMHIFLFIYVIWDI